MLYFLSPPERQALSFVFLTEFKRIYPDPKYVLSYSNEGNKLMIRNRLYAPKPFNFVRPIVDAVMSQFKRDGIWNIIICVVDINGFIRFGPRFEVTTGLTKPTALFLITGHGIYALDHRRHPYIYRRGMWRRMARIAISNISVDDGKLTFYGTGGKRHYTGWNGEYLNDENDSRGLRLSSSVGRKVTRYQEQNAIARWQRHH